MSYDLYVTRPGGDVVTTLRLLAGEENKAEAAKRFVNLVHRSQSKYNQFIGSKMETLRALGLLSSPTDVATLPPGSWFLQFTFTLAKPWMSKDDDPFYVTESVNPVRKDKVFKVPFMAASSWKGLLRWTLMHTRLALRKESLTPERFAQERFLQTLLFGDEKGEESGGTRDFAAHLDALKPPARQKYEGLLRAYYGLESKDPLPHHSGRLMFYPTFFDLIDVEVINPHSRRTKAGTHPIYLECVPAGAKGAFSLLYVPFDLIHENPASVAEEGGKHLRYLARAIRELFLTYGFSAKRTSGYGTATDEIENGFVRTRSDSKPLTHLSKLAQEVKNVAFWSTSSGR